MEGRPWGNATSDWEDGLERRRSYSWIAWAEKARRRMRPLYIAGLIGPG